MTINETSSMEKQDNEGSLSNIGAGAMGENK
jgi:hypothetical protein